MLGYRKCCIKKEFGQEKELKKQKKKEIKKKIKNERLTERNENGGAYYPKCFEKCEGNGSSTKCNDCEMIDNVCRKLAKYEDIEDECIKKNGVKLEEMLYWHDNLVDLVTEMIEEEREE